LQKFLRFGLETFAAARAAKEILLAPIFETMPGSIGIDAHAADRVDREFGLPMALFAAGSSGRIGVMMRWRRAHPACVLHPRHFCLFAHLIDIP
jgi:hypothetical protein